MRASLRDLRDLRLEFDGELHRAILADLDEHAGPHAPGGKWDPAHLVARIPSAQERPTFNDMLRPWIGRHVRRASNADVARCKSFLESYGGSHLIPAVTGYDGSGVRPRMVNLRTAVDRSLLRHFAGDLQHPFRRVVEVGGGYGRLAEAILRLDAGQQVIMIEAVPATLHWAYIYLSDVLPDKNVGLWHLVGPDGLVDCDCLIAPPWHVPASALRESDVCINISGFQEMLRDHVDRYLAVFDEATTEGGLIYLHNSRDFGYQHEYEYPPHWRRLFSGRTPFSLSPHFPVEIFRHTVDDWRCHNTRVERDFLGDACREYRTLVGGLRETRHRSPGSAEEAP